MSGSFDSWLVYGFVHGVDTYEEGDEKSSSWVKPFSRFGS